jgi:hypothetical protein
MVDVRETRAKITLLLQPPSGCWPLRRDGRDGVSTRSRPQGRRSIDGAGDGIGRRLVVDPPTHEVEPCLLVRPLEGKVHARQAIDGIDELLVGEGDAVVWICLIGDAKPRARAMVARQVKPPRNTVEPTPLPGASGRSDR